MASGSSANIHASCVEIAGAGVLLRGAPGSGKSDLALRLVDQGARLVSDDRTDLVREAGHVLASAPEEIAGLMEVRGIGIVRLPPLASTRLGLVVDLVPAEKIERMPGPHSEDVVGIALPVLKLAPFEAAAAAKVRLAANMVARGIMPVS